MAVARKGRKGTPLDYDKPDTLLGSSLKRAKGVVDYLTSPVEPRARKQDRLDINPRLRKRDRTKGY